MDNDGHLDILVGNRDQINQIMFNDGTGSFLNDIMTFPDTSQGTFRIRCADINQDGHMDVVVANVFGYNQIFYGDSTRTFAESVNIRSGQSNSSTICTPPKSNNIKTVVATAITLNTLEKRVRHIQRALESNITKECKWKYFTEMVVQAHELTSPVYKSMC